MANIMEAQFARRLVNEDGSESQIGKVDFEFKTLSDSGVNIFFGIALPIEPRLSAGLGRC